MDEQFTSSKTGVDLAKYIRKQAKKIKANGCITGDMFLNSAAKLAKEFKSQAKRIAKLKAERKSLKYAVDRGFWLRPDVEITAEDGIDSSMWTLIPPFPPEHCKPQEGE